MKFKFDLNKQHSATGTNHRHKHIYTRKWKAWLFVIAVFFVGVASGFASYRLLKVKDAVNITISDNLVSGDLDGTGIIKDASYLSIDGQRYMIVDEKARDSIGEHTKELAEMAKHVSGNVLDEKKWVACGDSFTFGPFSGEYNNKELYYSEEYKCWKTYAYHIAKRNNMKLVNEAISGSTMYYNGEDTNAFSYQRYMDIPNDADYITLMFGLNENNAPIGTISDNTNETVMGAWNVVLEYLIEHHPYAKIGIIISDSWLTTNVRNAMIEVAEYWGIPYLDLKGDQVPLGIDGKANSTINPKAIELRNKAFKTSEDNGHPNPIAQEYRSTFIENWLRSL